MGNLSKPSMLAEGYQAVTLALHDTRRHRGIVTDISEMYGFRGLMIERGLS